MAETQGGIITALALYDLASLVTTNTPVCHLPQAGEYSHCRGRCYTGTNLSNQTAVGRVQTVRALPLH